MIIIWLCIIISYIWLAAYIMVVFGGNLAGVLWLMWIVNGDLSPNFMENFIQQETCHDVMPQGLSWEWPGECVDLHRHMAFVFPGCVSGGRILGRSWGKCCFNDKMLLTGAFYAGNFREWSISSLIIIIPATPSNPSIPYVKRTSKAKFPVNPSTRTEIPGQWCRSFFPTEIRHGLLENPPFIDDFPTKTSIYIGFSSKPCFRITRGYARCWGWMLQKISQQHHGSCRAFRSSWGKQDG